jgi:hypothetical protein
VTGSETTTIQRVLRAAASGGSLGRVAETVLQAALSAAGGPDGVLLGTGLDHPIVLAVAGRPGPGVRAAAESAAAQGRPTRRADDHSARSVLAVPIRGGGRTLGALAVTGELDALDHGPFALLADAMAVALAAGPPPGASATELLEALGHAGEDAEPVAALRAVLGATRSLLGSTGGAMVTAGGTRVLAAEGIDAARLQAACDDPAFHELLVAEGTAVAPTPVASLVVGQDCALVSIPVRSRAIDAGRLLLILPRTPDEERLHLLDAFGVALGAVLVAPELRRRSRSTAQVLDASLEPFPARRWSSAPMVGSCR